MKRWLALALALLVGLCPLSAGATKPTDGEYRAPDDGTEEIVMPDSRHFDYCSVVTEIHLDGTLSRTIDFRNTYERDLAMRAQYGENLESLLSSRAAPFGFFQYSSLNGMDDAIRYGLAYYAFYSFSILHAAPERVLEFTAAVLQSEDNELALNMAAADAPGCVTVSLAERFDLSQCMDEGSGVDREVYADIWGWAVDSPEGSSSAVSVDHLWLDDRENAVTECTVIAPVERVTATVGAEKDGRGEVSLAFLPLKDALPVFRQTALEGLREAARELAAVREEGEEITLTFAGTPEEISRDLNAFVGAYLPEQGVPYGLRSYYAPSLFNYNFFELSDASSFPIDVQVGDSSAFNEYLISSTGKVSGTVNLDLTVGEASFTLSPVQTASRFKSGQLGAFTADLRPVVGSAPLILRAGEGIELIPEGTVRHGDSLYSDTRVNIRFVHTQTTLAPLPLILLGSLLILAGLVLFIRRFKEFRRLFASPAPDPPAPAEESPKEPEPEEEPIIFEIPEIVIADGEEEKP